MGLYRRRWKDRKGKTHRTDVWWLSYVVGGKQRCESTGTSNKRVAKKILDIRRAEIAEGRFSGLLKSHPPTLKEYFSKYLHSKTSLHPHTHVRYAGSQRALERFFGRTRLPEITDALVEAYKSERVQRGTGPAGVNRDLSLLRQVLQQAKRERYIAQNPLGDREHFLDERKKRIQAKPFTVEESGDGTVRFGGHGKARHRGLLAGRTIRHADVVREDEERTGTDAAGDGLRRAQ